MFSRILRKFKLRAMPGEYSTVEAYWSERAKLYGKHSVLNMAHGKKEFDVVTAFQKQVLFPLLESELQGTEKNVLDYGCGPGRFTCDLAKLIGGDAIGVDITQELLNIAPKSQSVTYQIIKSGEIPYADSSFDFVWVCLVLGGIAEEEITKTIIEINRVLRRGGLFFYVENTANAVSTNYWRFRDEATYLRLAAFCNPRVIGHYVDLGQQITIFAGRKIA